MKLLELAHWQFHKKKAWANEMSQGFVFATTL
jgi:hypothetical protein